jgi:hypothetical protein
MMTTIKKSILAGLVFGLLFGIFQAIGFDKGISFDFNRVLFTAPFSGLLFGLFIYLFSSSKVVKRQTQIENPNEEPIIWSGDANHFVNCEAVGGKLYLLTDKLQFQSHNFNIQNHGLTIEIEQIRDVSFYNTLGLVPNGLAITTSDGKKERFVVDNRKLWRTEIEKQKKCTNR